MIPNNISFVVFRDCWYLIDANWLNAWSRYVNGDPDEPAPGPLTTKDLLDENGNPLPRLTAKVDYRGVSPLVYYIFVELHGKDTNYPDVCRYTIDIYKPAVPVEKIVNISYRAIVSTRCIYKTQYDLTAMFPTEQGQTQGE